jgi:hypothetical protein
MLSLRFDLPARSDVSPLWDEVLRVLPLLSRNNASEQPLAVLLWRVCPRWAVAQPCQSAPLCLGHELD